MQELEALYLKQKKIIGFKKETQTKIEIQDLNKMCSIMNLIGIERMKVKQYTQAQDWFTRSIKYAKYNPYLMIDIQNNLACLYKKQKNYGLAILHLQKSQQLIITNNSNAHQSKKLLADCLINMCSVLSAMKQHSLALKSIHKSILLLKQYKNETKQISQIYSIAKFNEAIELEHLHRWKDSIKAYQEVKQFIIDNCVSVNFVQIINNALQSLKNKKQPNIKRRLKVQSKTTSNTPRRSVNYLKIVDFSTKQNSQYQSQSSKNHFKSMIQNNQIDAQMLDQKIKFKQKRNFSIKIKKSTLENIPPI